MTDDAISRQAVLDILRTCYDTERKDYTDGSEWINYEDAVTEIENLPSVNPQEPKTGKWIRQDSTKEPLYGWYFCSECNSVIGDKTKYCSNCGCRMIEPQESEDKE